MARGCTSAVIIAVAFVASWCCVETAPAQAPPAATAGSVAPMTTEERLAVENADGYLTPKLDVRAAVFDEAGQVRPARVQGTGR